MGNNNDFKEFLLSILNDKNAHLIKELELRWNEWKKVNNPLFTTVNGVDIYFMDEYYSVTDNWEIRFSNATQEINYASRTFSTKEAAEEYILLNKRCLSLNDILDSWNDNAQKNFYKDAPLFLRFKEVAKQKINK